MFLTGHSCWQISIPEAELLIVAEKIQTLNLGNQCVVSIIAFSIYYIYMKNTKAKTCKSQQGQMNGSKNIFSFLQLLSLHRSDIFPGHQTWTCILICFAFVFVSP